MLLLSGTEIIIMKCILTFNFLAQALGAFFFFVMSWYVISDKSKAERQIACNADILGPENQPTPDRYREDVDFREGTQPIYRPPVDT